MRLSQTKGANMFPWLWFWAPQLHMPWSGDVAQRIAPNTHWLFGSISPVAGNGVIEQRVFENVASYGKQLGLLTEVVMELADKGQSLPDEVQQALGKLGEIRQQIEEVKYEEYRAYEERVTEWLEKMKRDHAEEYAGVRERLLASLSK